MPTPFLCVTCGTQFAPANEPPAECRICTDPRQFVGFDGQQWTTLSELQRTYHNTITSEEPGLHSIHTEPHFAIGQRAFLLETAKGNVLWDCLALLDQTTTEAIRALGGIAAIAISHPHYYTTMAEWSATFEGAPIYLHSADRQWVMRTDAKIRFWEGDSTPLLEDLTLIHTPGHFKGFQVLHWPAGAAGRGVLLSGDQPQVCMDTHWVSFMYSYPNYVPLARRSVQEIVAQLERWRFGRIYGAFPHRTVQDDAKNVVRRSAERYFQALG
ncbi:MAG: MBL fold metallo-hydrolase [Acidobacteriia bacterium]|nr:MBL fold metallo-hydrolase [Terriglobia bacterium]